MNNLTLTDAKLDPNPFWSIALDSNIKLGPELLDIFEQNGYEMTEAEQMYAAANGAFLKKHYPQQHCLKNQWMTMPLVTEGPHLNHCLLFERKGFIGEALAQLKEQANTNTLLYKLIKLKPKWGFDFSMDYTDKEGNVLEVFHYEYDGFHFDEINEKRIKYEPILLSIDWADAAKKLIARKSEWSHLEFFEQSAWKCKYFGFDNERWKMVVWD